jgi:heavy metal efflux system protein
MMSFFSAVVHWSLGNRPVVLLATALLVALGVRAAIALPIDVSPDITTIQVQIITSAPALSPVEIEQYVTIPVERSMAGIPRSNEVRSISKYGVSVVTVSFEDGTDIYWARQLVNERMAAARDSVPKNSSAPEMGPISSGLGEVFQFVVKNPKLDSMQLKELLTWKIGPALRMVPGVVEVNSFGGEDRQYEVTLDPVRLQATGISISQVIDALGKSNANAGGGYIERNREHFVIGTDGLVRNLDDLQSVVIGSTQQGTPMTLATVGDVKFSGRLRRGAATANGEGEVVVGVALMLMGENARTVTNSIKEKLELLQPALPAGTTLEPFYDRAKLVDRTIKTVGTNLLEGALLVILVLLLLLGDLRAGLVVAVTIPLSMMFALILMNAFGLTGNLMSLGAVDFGLLVDGAVIIVENTVRRLSMKLRESSTPMTSEETLQVVESATLEVRAASVFGEAIIAIVYLPVLALSGVEGKLFTPMAVTVLFALAGAFVLSLTLVPVLTSLFVRASTNHRDSWLMAKAQQAYDSVFQKSLRHSTATITAAVFALALAVFGFSHLGAEFIPQLDEGDLLIEARRLTGASLTEALRTDLILEKEILKIPEVEKVVARNGSPELATDSMSIEASDIYIVLKERNQWRPGLVREDIAKELSVLVERSPEIGGGISQPIQMRTNELVAGIRSDVGVLLYGTDLDTLTQYGNALAAVIQKIPGAVDVRVEQVEGLKYLRVVPERNRLARYGLTIADVNQLTETIAVGHNAGEVLEGERRFAIVVKTKLDDVDELDAIRALPLHSVNSVLVPLGDVAEVFFTDGPAQVSREGQSRRLTVEFNVRERDLLSVVKDAQAAVATVTRPVGYRVEWGGQFKHYIEARGRLSVVVPLALVLIAFLLFMSFGDLKLGALIFLNVPFAIVGGVFLLWLRQIPFSISAGVGFVALFGVAVLNGLVLISFAKDLEAQGISRIESIVQAAKTRFRPVLMTALVASLGFVPMAISTAPGSEVQRPLATVVIGGLVSATLLTLLVLPVLYRKLFSRD